MKHILLFAAALAVGASYAVSNVCLTNTANAAYTLDNSHMITLNGTTKGLQQTDAFFSKGGTLSLSFANPATAPAGLEEFVRTNNDMEMNDLLLFRNAYWGVSQGVQPKPRYAAERLNGVTDGQTAVLYSGSWYVPADATYSFFSYARRTCRLAIDSKPILAPGNYSKACTRNVALTQGWHTFDVMLGPGARSGDVVSVGPQDTAVIGLLYSPVNADLNADQSAGYEFMAQADGHLVSTANAATIIPRIAVQGGNAEIDCTYCGGGLRIMGSLYRKTGNVGTITFSNMPAGSTVYVGNTFRGSYTDILLASYIDWPNVVFPAGTKLVFQGFAAIDSNFPDNIDYEIGSLDTSLIVRKKDFFGTYEQIGTDFHYPNGLKCLALLAPDVIDSRCTIHVASGQQFRSFGGYFDKTSNTSPKSNEGQVTWSRTDNAFATHSLSNNLVVDGSIWMQEPFGRAPRYFGNVTGAGNLYLNGWSGQVGFYGDELSLDGNSQCSSRDNTVHVGAKHAYLKYFNLGADYGLGRQSPRLHYCVNPLTMPDATPFRIGTLHFGSSAPTPNPGGDSGWRKGAIVQVYSNNTICVGKMTGSGAFFWGDRAKFTGNLDWANSTGNFGPGNVIVGSIESALTLYVATNISFTVTNMTQAVAFKYDAESNSVNHAKLDVKGTMVAGASVTATDLYMLPSRIGGFTNGTIRLTGAASLNEGRTYNIELDFDQGIDGLYNLNGCDGSGTLAAAPAAGTLNVTFKGENRPQKGRYAIFGCSAGGSLLDGWTVNLARRAWKGMAFELKRDETGIWLDATASGATIIFR